MRISDWSSDVCSSDLRYSGDELPAHPGVLLPNPRSHDSEPSGWRHWQLIPFGDLLYERRAGKGGGGDDRRRERVGPVAGQGRHRGEACGWKRSVTGQGVWGSVDVGGGRSIKKK